MIKLLQILFNFTPKNKNMIYVGIKEKEKYNETNKNDNKVNESNNEIIEKYNKIKDKGKKIKKSYNEIDLTFYNIYILKNFFNFEYQIKTIINDKINNIKYDFNKDEILDEKNLQKKLEGDLQILFEDNQIVFNIGDKINSLNMKIDKNNINKFKIHLKNILDLFYCKDINFEEKTIKIYEKFEENLKLLNINVLCQKIYFYTFLYKKYL